jgi:hypothetical protein
MMNIAMTIANLDGSEVEVVAKASDLIEFERKYDTQMTVFADPKRVRVEYIYWLAWHTCKRAAHTDLPFDEWVDSIDEVRFGGQGESNR